MKVKERGGINWTWEWYDNEEEARAVAREERKFRDRVHVDEETLDGKKVWKVSKHLGCGT